MAESAMNTGAAPTIRSSAARSVVLCRIRVLLCFVRESSRSGISVTSRGQVFTCAFSTSRRKSTSEDLTPLLREGPDPHVHVARIDLQLRRAEGALRIRRESMVADFLQGEFAA